MEEYRFYHTSTAAARDVFPESKEAAVVVLKDFDERQAVFRGDFVKDPVPFTDFLYLHMYPTVVSATERILEKILAENKRKGVFLFRPGSTEENIKYDEEFRKVATAMRSKDYFFVQADTKNPLGKLMAETFGVDDSVLPLVEAVEVKDETMMYRHTGPIQENSIKEFIQQWQKGTVPRFFTSEPEPKDNAGPIYKVVGKSFRREVMEGDRDAVVKFYAPWCGFCKMLEPIYAQLAKTLGPQLNVKFCEIDATKNDIEGQPIEGYPTIKFYPKKNRQAAVLYNGDITEESIGFFIKQQMGVRVEPPAEQADNKAAQEPEQVLEKEAEKESAQPEQATTGEADQTPGKEDL